MNQQQLIAEYSDSLGMDYNPDLFIRDDNKIIEILKTIILACQRSRVFIIKVVSFEIIEEYDKIKQAKIDYERSLFEEKNKNSKVVKQFDDSKFNVIDINESVTKILAVNYYLSANNECAYVRTLIEIPTIVNKYYRKIFGNNYLSINQIVDASTYNNSASKSSNKNSKKQNVAFKTTFMKTQIFREFQILKDTNKESVRLTSYISAIFNKRVYTYKYILAKYGYYGALEMMGMQEDCIYVTDFDPKCDDLVTFCKKAGKIYISSPRFIFESQEPVQALVYTIYKTISKESHMKEYETRKFWLKSLGEDFGNDTVEKALSVLDSLDHIYDDIVKNAIRLPEHKKKDIYAIFKWMLGDYNALRQKDNLDISTKRIRNEELLGCHYAQVIAKGIYRASDLGKDVNISTLIRAVRTPPDILLKKIVSDSLVMIRNNVNANDAFSALKFSFKGLSGIGENSKSAIPDSYRAVNLSHLDRIDLSSGSNGDPGISGLLCPMADIYENGSFSEFEEPNSWESNFNTLLDLYKKTEARKNIKLLEAKLLEKKIDPDELAILDDNLESFRGMVVPFYFTNNDCIKK